MVYFSGCSPSSSVLDRAPSNRDQSLKRELSLPLVAAVEREAALEAEGLPDVPELAATATKAALPLLSLDGAVPWPARAADLAQNASKAAPSDAFVASAAARAALAAVPTLAVDEVALLVERLDAGVDLGNILYDLTLDRCPLAAGRHIGHLIDAANHIDTCSVPGTGSAVFSKEVAETMAKRRATRKMVLAMVV